ncbi:amidohydrolase family protein [Microbacterium sp. C5A9]|uniref:amidohydrolase family protein n=1 Tax=Microbacterium sp. C5A9 TaxID=2736663 RepID=UPI0027E2CCF2|nr:amidohydrolase family protein [Microbacterium sp. C5A9]MCI1017235.1 amidohydrolase family protein [Microbacterium sp. C5A9]
MTVVDAHLHVWDTTRNRHPWLDDEPDLRAPFLPQDVESQLVTRAVFVQADAADGLEEARWVQSLAPSWPHLAGIVAFAPVEDRAGLIDALDALADLEHFVGVRRLVQDEPPGFLTSTGFVEGLRELARRDVPFDACVRWHQLPELVDAVAQAPDVQIVLDHLGKPPVAAGYDSDERRRWSTALRALAQHPNVSAKLSGLAPEARPQGPLFAQVEPFVREALDLFGPHRMLAGSDFPVSAATDHHLEYDRWFEWIRDDLGFDDSERSLVLHDNAERIYTLAPVDRPAPR